MFVCSALPVFDFPFNTQLKRLCGGRLADGPILVLRLSRELVETGYYPLIVVLFLLLFIGSTSCVFLASFCVPFCFAVQLWGLFDTFFVFNCLLVGIFWVMQMERKKRQAVLAYNRTQRPHTAVRVVIVSCFLSFFCLFLVGSV